MHYLSSVYFAIQPLYVLGIFVAYHQDVYCIYRVAQNNVYTLWHEKYYSIIVTTVFIQEQNRYERCPWILDSI